MSADIALGLGELLDRAGDEWGPLGVALAAAERTDIAVLVRQLSESADQQPPSPTPPSPEAIPTTETSAGPTPTIPDAEVGVMAVVAQFLDPLDADARDRVLMWAHSRFMARPEATGPRTHWLEDLPATGEVVRVDGRDLHVDTVRFDYEDEVLTMHLVAARIGSVSLPEATAALVEQERADR